MVETRSPLVLADDGGEKEWFGNRWCYNSAVLKKIALDLDVTIPRHDAGKMKGVILEKIHRRTICC